MSGKRLKAPLPIEMLRKRPHLTEVFVQQQMKTLDDEYLVLVLRHEKGGD